MLQILDTGSRYVVGPVGLEPYCVRCIFTRKGGRVPPLVPVIRALAIVTLLNCAHPH